MKVISKDQAWQYLKGLSTRQKVLTPVCVLAILYGLATRQGQPWEPIAKQAFQPNLNSIAIANDEDVPVESKAILELNNQQSSIVLGLATEFKIMAIKLQNDPTQKCSKLPKIEDCLYTFLETRLMELTNLAVDPLPSRQNLEVNGQKTLEVTALMVAIAQSIPASERNSIQNTLLAEYPETAKFRPATFAQTLALLNQQKRLDAVKEQEKAQEQQTQLNADICAGLTPEQQQGSPQCQL